MRARTAGLHARFGRLPAPGSALAPALALAFAIMGCSDLPLDPERQPTEATLEAEVATHTTAPVAVGSAARTCEDGNQSSGALFRICIPERWNGSLVVYAHGYVSPLEPLLVRDDEVDGTTVSEIVNQLGFGFATSSYSKNGLAVLPAVADLVDVVEIFRDRHGEPNQVYMVGVSEGGLATMLAVEQNPAVFDGGLAGCGPIGDFRRQVNYFGDFRVVFDYFFPDVMPGSPVRIPQEVMNNWETVYVPRIKSAIASDPDATKQLLRVTRAPTDPNDPSTNEETIIGLLWYNVFATNDGVAQLGGQPYGNRRRFYFGSRNDFRLNFRIQRFRAEAAALDEIEAHYQTSGNLVSPIVTIHTTGDPIIPYWHDPLYFWKATRNGSFLRHAHIPVFRYGHCSFEVSELLVGFAVLVLKTTLQDLVASSNVFPNAEAQVKFLELAHEHGARPTVIELSE